VIETARLILRPFGDADREAFAAINGDPRVGDWLGGPIDRAASDAAIERINRHGRLIGMIGLMHLGPELPPGPAVEIGWRLAPDIWGQGFASEGASAALAWAFVRLGAPEIIAITAVGNRRSRAVMERIGMVEQPARAFDHPDLADGHPLRKHVVYAALNLGA
jgi:RimJ/RimL family protein N-acetyltransferase